jgi:hypothetical protein
VGESRENGSQTGKNAPKWRTYSPSLGTESRDYSEGRTPAIKAVLSNPDGLGKGADQLPGATEVGRALKLLDDRRRRLKSL